MKTLPYGRGSVWVVLVLAVTAAIAKRAANASPNNPQAQLAPRARINARTAQGKVKVKSNPAYPEGREARIVRAHRSWCAKNPDTPYAGR